MDADKNGVFCGKAYKIQMIRIYHFTVTLLINVLLEIANIVSAFSSRHFRMEKKFIKYKQS